ncbi:MAG: response regulator transcription factor [Bacteroidota bacterium]
MSNKKHKILIVEDDLNLGLLLSEYLGSEGYKVTLSRDGVSGLESFTKEKFDICILDIMMPKMDGFDLARKIREQDKDIPFIFLTAKSLKQDKLKGFEIGAEDYVSKPFDEEELLCRIKVILKRTDRKPTDEDCMTRFSLGDYQFDYNCRELIYKGKTVRLTEKENEVLRLLCLHKNKILRRNEAVEIIYGEDDYFLGRSFDVFISRLRKLLKEDPGISIENVFKVGFILNVKEC